MGLTLVWTVEVRFGELEEFWGIHHSEKDKEVMRIVKQPERDET